MSESSALELRDITVERGGRPVVKNVTITVPAGEVTALLGPNGAGKSSLVLSVGGVLRPRSGSVLLDGAELAGKRSEKVRAAGVAIVPEGRRLLPDLSVDDNIRVATYALSKHAAAEGRARALELFPRLGERLSVPARALSGGEQQMVVLAQALVSQPKFILIDELSLGLAPVIVNRLVPVIRSVAESGIGVLLIEQFATVALSMATAAHVMEGGMLRYSGTAAELRAHPEMLHSAYLLRGSEEQGDATAEPDDATAESDEVSAESDDATAESDDATAESDEVSAESDDATAESDEVSAESDDATAEPDEVSAEPDDATVAPDDVNAESDVAGEESAKR